MGQVENILLIQTPIVATFLRKFDCNLGEASAVGDRFLRQWISIRQQKTSEEQGKVLKVIQSTAAAVLRLHLVSQSLRQCVPSLVLLSKTQSATEMIRHTS